MIELVFALVVQAMPIMTQDPPMITQDLPPSTAADICVELEGRGRAVVDGRRLSGRALTRAVAERIPAGRPLFISFANERAGNDVDGMTAVLTGAASAPEIVVLETCELPAGDIAQ